jgi:hypothetical protein
MGKKKTFKNTEDSDHEDINDEVLKNMEKDMKLNKKNTQNFIYIDNTNQEENENNLASNYNLK